MKCKTPYKKDYMSAIDELLKWLSVILCCIGAGFAFAAGDKFIGWFILGAVMPACLMVIHYAREDEEE